MTTSTTIDNNQYWTQLSIHSSDLDYLVNYLLENEKPHTLDQLAFALVHHRHESLVNAYQEILDQGTLYRPSNSFEVGEKIMFPHLENMLGTVTDVREGHNPEYEPFKVIKVETEAGQLREFVAELEMEHPLNAASYRPDMGEDLETIYGEYGSTIRDNLRDKLEKDSEYVNVGDNWFARDLLLDIDPVLLNIAEALLDMEGGGPVTTEALVKEIELPTEVPEDLRIFSLEHALLHDRRFDEVGPTGQALWYLREMEPVAVQNMPAPLQYIPETYDASLLDETMRSLEAMARDEWSDYGEEDNVDDKFTIVLTYPHLLSGTLPLAKHVAKFFPTARITDRIRFDFVDKATEEKFPGWVVRSGRYVYGLHEWFERVGVGVGSYIDLSTGEEPGTINISVRVIKSRRREWLRTISVREKQPVFEVTRVSVACEFDELAAVAIEDHAAVAALASQYEKASLEQLLDVVFNGLAGLSLQRAVHAYTLYSVINLVRRIPPAPLLTALVLSPKFTSLGDNYWAYHGED